MSICSNRCDGTADPDFNKCVSIPTQSSVEEMILPCITLKAGRFNLLYGRDNELILELLRSHDLAEDNPYGIFERKKK